MKIGIDAHNLEIGYGGAAHRYIYNLLKIWNDTLRGTEPHFILYFKKKIPQELNFLNPALFTKKILKSPFGIESNALFVHYLLSQAAQKDKLDLLFSPYYILPVFYKEKTAVTLHDIFYEANPKEFNWNSWFDKILLKWVSKISAKNAKIILTCSKFSKSEIIKYYKISPEKIFTIYLGVDEKFVRVTDNIAIQKIKEKYGINNKFLFFIGSIFNRRHIIETIKSFDRISSKLPEYQFLIIGKNSTRPVIDIEKIIKNINIQAKKEVSLYKENVSDEDLILLYSAASLFIWLSDYEGFGLPLLEAQAMGIPVLSSATSSIPEVVGESAFLIKNINDVSEISNAMYSILTNKNLKQMLIKKGFENVKRFSWEKCAEETLKIITNF